MKKNLIILFCVFLITFNLTVEGTLNNNNNNFFNKSLEYITDIKEENKKLSLIEKKSDYLEISNIKGGSDITFSIINRYIDDIEDIDIHIKIEGSGLVLPKNIRIEIPLIFAGESKELKIKIFGFGIGKISKFLNFKQINDFQLIIIK